MSCVYPFLICKGEKYNGFIAWKYNDGGNGVKSFKL